MFPQFDRPNDSKIRRRRASQCMVVQRPAESAPIGNAVARYFGCANLSTCSLKFCEYFTVNIRANATSKGECAIESIDDDRKQWLFLKHCW